MSFPSSPPLQALVAAAASFVVVSLFFGLVYYLCHRPSKSSSSTTTSRSPAARRTRHRGRSNAPILPIISHSSPGDPPQPGDSRTFDDSLGQISMAVLRKATRNFHADLVIGDGSFGFVYRAQLEGRPVAIKRLSSDAFHGDREFRAEIETLGLTPHPNLVRILGYCESGRDRVLVYEFVERGSLDSWLHEERLSDPPLPWASRVRILHGVAKGLSHLHDGCKRRVIHRDIKASNVLINAEFEARIADYGLARPVDSNRSHVSTQVAGTAGYMPPEYREGILKATVKSDVYSYGVLMLEAATGKRPNLPVSVPPKVEGGKRRELGLVGWARMTLGSAEKIGREGEGKGDDDEGTRSAAAAAMEMLDPQMDNKDGVDPAQVLAYFKIALRCSHDHVRERPVMKEVVDMFGSL